MIPTHKSLHQNKSVISLLHSEKEDFVNLASPSPKKFNLIVDISLKADQNPEEERFDQKNDVLNILFGNSTELWRISMEKLSNPFTVICPLP